MTTIPLKDGAPDWGRVGPEETYAANLIARAAYIAALERCAEWHEAQKEEAESAPHINAKSLGVMDAHEESAATIRQWIEKEKQG